MCGACGRTVVPDPVLGPVRTMRQHLIVAQTINSICQYWAGTPKVVATSEGWLLSGPKGVTEPVSTVEKLWTAILRDYPGAPHPDLPDLLANLGDGETGDMSLRVLALGQHLSRNLATASACGPEHTRKEPE
jgi:hypothetical protein